MKDKMFIAKQLMNKVGLRKSKSEVHRRQMELNKLYAANPNQALIVDSAVVIGQNLSDPFRTEVLINSEFKVPMKVGVHRAVGGDHDYPNPGDILCASLAACVESTLRMIASRLEIELFETKIEVTASIDVRGTLIIDRAVPVGFQSMHIAMEIGARNISDKMIHTLVNATKRSCVVYQTLKKGLPITKELKIIREKNT
ncbi:MAG: OsmC family protein [Saprospiraceae bacterium]|nr:OsmC family protein [Saprospiraceae bacterium]MCF8251690.1 OsmC family protein [Saprospiraceae bacterium]MCF8282035.1 OsmC family protein [Bacteroidales bacterium]MCF8311245.1 OsmC family protein [Saprospiraceae bacterium]MCF8442053.1 OsmC family protein [Saprospiraceae bacterium]